MRLRTARGLLVTGAALFLVVACQAGPGGQATQSTARGEATPAATLRPIVTASASPADASPGCDPVEKILASMFVGLSDAALSNAGIEREQFLAALTNNRALLKDYLMALGLPYDDAWIDAAINASPGRQLLSQCLGVAVGLPTASP